jgi:hypothetical protein
VILIMADSVRNFMNETRNVFLLVGYVVNYAKIKWVRHVTNMGQFIHNTTEFWCGTYWKTVTWKTKENIELIYFLLE